MKWFEFLCEFLFLQGASIIIIPSKSALQQFKVFHIERKKKVIINPAPNIIDQGNTVFRKKARRLFFVGHIEYRKGLDVLLTALGSLKDLDLHLDIAGFLDAKSTYVQEIKRIITLNKLERNVSFHGLLSPKKLVSLYQKADIFIFPSRHETYGMVIVEAMSFGLPVIASAIPTTMEIMKNDVNGILYETEDHKALANAIRKLTSANRLRRKIMLNNIMNTKNLRTWDDVGEENLRALINFLQR
jgi:glycosyltransferase involved in cell wall biosynthesis